MMKHYITILLIAITLFSINCGGESAEVDLNAEKMNVENALTEYMNNLAQRNWDMLRANSTHDMILLENGLEWNLDSLINAMEKEWAGYEISYNLDFVKTEIEGPMAWAFYHSKGTGQNDTLLININWLESANFIKNEDTWKVAFIHSTVVGQPVVTKKEKME